MDQPSIAELVDRARNGNPAERDRLFAACRPYLNLLARAQVEGWLRAKVDASDIVQQTLLEVHRDFDRFQGQTDAQWWAWLRRIMAHNAADLVRRYTATAKRQARREVSFAGRRGDISGADCFDPSASILTPSQEVVRRDEQFHVAQALEQLPPDYREVIMLRNLQRLPFDEVAERMGRSRPAVQMLWMRALKKLEGLLRDPST